VHVTGPQTKEASGYIKRMMATYAGAEDLISVGAYVKGSNAEIDEAIEKMPAIDQFLRQRIEEKASLSETLKRAGEIAGIEIPGQEQGAGANEAVPVQA
jgi:flagellum-specific ATP synthase